MASAVGEREEREEREDRERESRNERGNQRFNPQLNASANVSIMSRDCHNLNTCLKTSPVELHKQNSLKHTYIYRYCYTGTP